MSAQVERVKREAIYLGLTRAVGDAFWKAKMACENASKDDLKKFTTEIRAARMELDRAEEFYKERAADPTSAGKGEKR